MSSPEIDAAVSNFGGLGSFGALSLSPEKLETLYLRFVHCIEAFAVNLWVSMEDDAARTSDRVHSTEASHAGELLRGITVASSTVQTILAIRFEDQARILLDEKVPSSVSYSEFTKRILDECRAKGILTIGTATTPDEAVALQELG